MKDFWGKFWGCDGDGLSSSEAKALLMDELSGLNFDLVFLQTKYNVNTNAALIQKISDEFDMIFKVPN